MAVRKVKLNQIKKITQEELNEQALINTPDEVVKAGSNRLKGWLDLLGQFVVVGGDFV